MMVMSDRVPMYKLRANRGLLWSALFVLIIGGLLSFYFFSEDAQTLETRRGVLVLIVTLVTALLMVIAATAHFWFKHLWHHRPGYKRG
jgi:hypothetical protein